MKQSERKKVQSILDNIRKQHNILESLPEKEVFALLEENQGTIIELGNYVEQNMGQTAPFIRMLEEYCELVYQMFQSMKKTIDFRQQWKIKEQEKSWSRQKIIM